jgi:c-di-AMP phosphodiesterase-like protein
MGTNSPNFLKVGTKSMQKDTSCFGIFHLCVFNSKNKAIMQTFEEKATRRVSSLCRNILKKYANFINAFLRKIENHNMVAKRNIFTRGW